MATHEQVAAIPDTMYFVLQCYPCLTVEEGHIAFQSTSKLPFSNTWSLSNQQAFKVLLSHMKVLPDHYKELHTA